MIVERDGDRITLDVQFISPDRTRKIPGARWDSKQKRWHYPLSWATCVVARGVLGSDLKIGPKLVKWASERRHDVEQISELKAQPDAPGHERLYPHQRTGVAFLNQAGSALVADDMGVGKTAQTVQSLRELDSYPALIVCPNGVKRSWEREFKRWDPKRKVLVAKGGTKQAEEAASEVTNGAADVLIINWEALPNVSRLAPYGSIRLEGCSKCDPLSTRNPSRCHREPKVLNTVRWAAVVADEAHRAKSPKSLQTRALWAVGDESDRRIALTGTPIANNIEDLWAVMRFVSPEEYPAKWPWVNRYALLAANVFSGGSDIIGIREENKGELWSYLGARFIRRTKDEVLADLPPKVYIRRTVTLKGKQLKAYKQMEKEMVADIEGGKITADNVLTASIRLAQLASAYGQVESSRDWNTGADDPDELVAVIDRQVKLSEPSSKLDALEEVLVELAGRKAVVFAYSSQLIDLVAERLQGKYPIARYHGGISESERERALAEFEEGEVQLFLATVGAGGEGITLTAADTAIFLQRPWSQVQSSQAEDRLHRIGQAAHSVTYIDLVTEGTVEEDVLARLREKASQARDVLEGDK